MFVKKKKKKKKKKKMEHFQAMCNKAPLNEG
jgi:hypothetical protein